MLVVTLRLRIRYFNTPREHWSLLVHPGTSDVTPVGLGGAEIHAVIGGDDRLAVLETLDVRNRLQEWAHSRVLVIKTLTMTTVKEIREILRAVKLNQPPPDQNCVDWCILGVEALKGAGFLRERDLEEFMEWVHRAPVIRRQTSGAFQ